MQILAKMVEQIRSENPAVTSEELINIIREYLQIIILKSIYQSKFGRDISFMGGTCLRICYDLKRYSDDLDFSLDRKTAGYSFQSLNQLIQRDFSLRNIKMDLSISEDKTVQKVFIKAVNLLEPLGLSRIKDQKLHIKIEVDTNPVDIKYGGRETFFVNKYNEVFPILKHDLETLFAGKVLAILCRSYRKGRDFYDLIWYLNRGTKVNLAYLNEGLKVANYPSNFSNEKVLFEAIERVVLEFEPDFILKDIGRFLEDPKEEAWLRQYKEVFSQLKNRRFG
ncbi:MAG TPA: hypothetical protein DCW86_02445 [Actinobacteria bacterium]|nr:hypothetical protein [Actinomycetota bacterium]